MAEGSSNFGPAVDNVMERKPLVLNNRGYRWITDHVSSMVEAPVNFIWLVLTIIFGMIATLVPIQLAYQVSTGVGVWGLNNPVYWAWDITNFVFWIGIGHAGTLISAILFITRQKWRTSINRSAEAMTIFAVICAGIFPAFHVGRVWFAWYLFPIPNSNVIWQNFKSPLLWDVFAVSTYFTVSLLFWYTGLVPDLATIRDRAKNKLRKWFYGILSLGWRGSNRNWQHYEKAYLILAGSRRHWSFPCTVSSPSTLPPRSSRVGTPPFSRLTLWPGLFSGALPWCSPS
jgi:hypothetical protein